MKRWILWLGCALLSVQAFGQSGEEQAKRQARSVHLQHRGWGKDAQIFYIEATADRFAPGSYMCLLGFDGGYAGVQARTNGQTLAIFSVWEVHDSFDFAARPEDVAPEKRTRLLYQGLNVTVKRFGGEGTGGQSRIDGFPWRLGSPVRMAVSCAPDGERRTAYTCWIWREAEGDWLRMATFSTPLGNGNAALNGPYSFLEDFWRNGQSKTLVRTARFSRLWAYGQDGWKPSTQCTFTADNNTLTTIDAGPWAEGGWLATGGETRNLVTKLWRTFPLGGAEDDSAARREKLLQAVQATLPKPAAAKPAPEAKTPAAQPPEA